MSKESNNRNKLAEAIEQLAIAIRPPGTAPAEGQGGTIDSLLEANMDIAYSLNQIAKAINYFAEEVADIRIMLDSKLEDK